MNLTKIAVILSSLVVVITLNSASSINLNKIDDLEWTSFKIQFNKMYIDDDEDLFRKKLYFESKSKVSEHNNMYEKGQYTYKMAINQFADMAEQEFVTKMSNINGGRKEGRSHNTITLLPPENAVIPVAVDWRMEECVTPVRKQGRCRSDWVISALGTIEAQYCIKSQKLVSLSVQNVIDCLNPGGTLGCHGGQTDDAFLYIFDNKGIDTEESYPYENKVGECRYNSSNSGAIIQGYGTINHAGNEMELMEAVAIFGPMSVGIDVSAEFRMYSNGVYYDRDWSPWSQRYTCNSMLVVGYGTDAKAGDYWIVKNSWGENWGNKGYILIARNKNNNLGIATLVRFPLID